ncbi:M48 family metalloprotease [Acinetobacter brisouii]|uniref:M48 family metalloprotease n=2 Tax=Acinetobacter brisouii TaxID=396323 RepID=UPI00406A4736
MTGPPGKAQMSHRDRRHAQAAAGFTLLLEPAVASGLTLRLYGARPLHPNEAPDLWAVLRELAARAGLPAVPVPHYVPSGVVNAFATGTKHHAAIALTDCLLRSLTPRGPTGIGFGARQDRAGESRLAAARMGQAGTLLFFKHTSFLGHTQK